MQKLQTAINELYYNPAKNGYEKKATVSITDGNLRITSGQRLSTSAISVTTNTDGTAGTDELFGGSTNVIGRFPATVPTAVAARLPDDSIYDGVTYTAAPSNVFVSDNGRGGIQGIANGSINYETGELHMIDCPPNAEFVFSCLHTSAFSGKINSTDSAKMNGIKAIYGNMPNQKQVGELTIIRR